MKFLPMLIPKVILCELAGKIQWITSGNTIVSDNTITGFVRAAIFAPCQLPDLKVQRMWSLVPSFNGVRSKFA